MAVTVGRSAALAVLIGIHAALNVAALKTALGWTVGVYADYVPQGAAFPYVRSRFITEVPDSTFGRNGKAVSIAIDLFDDTGSYRGPGRVLTTLSTVIALLNPVNNYHAITVTGYTVIHVEYEQADDADPEQIASELIAHKVVRLRVIVEEA
jgi:hypothetical protein